jgi:hypothetical protein
MECLRNYIGIIGCGAPVPPVIEDEDGEEVEDLFSGLYINQLPGINLRSIEKLADDEQENYLGVWNDVQTRALLKFSIAFRKNIYGSYKVNQTTAIECLICNNKSNFAVALWYLMGVEMMIERTSSDRLNRYTTTDLEKAERLKAEFYAEYIAAFNDSVSSLDVLGSDCVTGCIECGGGTITFVESLP